MKVKIEVLPCTYVNGEVRYQVHYFNLRSIDGDPANLVHKVRADFNKEFIISADRFIWHSTSWRYSKPSKIILTYLLFSEDMKFLTPANSISKADFIKYPANSIGEGEPGSGKKIHVKDVLIHGIRHLKFLHENDITIKNSSKEIFEKTTVKFMQTIFPTLAGEV